MFAISTTARRRIEAQGFVGLDDGTLASIQYWLRLSPAMCMVWTVAGLFLGSPIILWALVPFAASVNVGPGNAGAAWMDTQGLSPVHHENFDWTVALSDPAPGDRWRGATGFIHEVLRKAMRDQPLMPEGT